VEEQRRAGRGSRLSCGDEEKQGKAWKEARMKGNEEDVDGRRERDYAQVRVKLF
jgi:hypothetical protein